MNLPLRQFPEGQLSVFEVPIESPFWEGLFWDDVFTGSSAITLGSWSASASGTFATPFTGSAAVTLGAFTAQASGTFTKPTFTGSLSATLSGWAASASGTFSVPTFTGSAGLTFPAFTATAVGTVAGPTFTGSAALTAPAFTSYGSFSAYILPVDISAVTTVSTRVSRTSGLCDVGVTRALPSMFKTWALIDNSATKVETAKTKTSILVRQ